MLPNLKEQRCMNGQSKASLIGSPVARAWISDGMLQIEASPVKTLLQNVP